MKTVHVSRSKWNPASAALIILLAASTVSFPVHAGLYLELDYEFGGDTLAGTDLEDLDAGSGYKIAVGLQRFIGGFDDVGLIFSLGYLFNWLEASNGDADTDAVVAEFLYFRDFGQQRLGVGGSYHMNPRYRDDLDGFSKTRIDFDNALGLVVRYSYVIDKSLEFGIRYTSMDYEADGVSIDADSLGLYISTAY